jgi:hypothetical protein
MAEYTAHICKNHVGDGAILVTTVHVFLFGYFDNISSGVSVISLNNKFSNITILIFNY